MIYDIRIGIGRYKLETRESNPHSLGPKPNALPVKLAPIKIRSYWVYVVFVSVQKSV